VEECSISSVDKTKGFLERFDACDAPVAGDASRFTGASSVLLCFEIRSRFQEFCGGELVVAGNFVFRVELAPFLEVVVPFGRASLSGCNRSSEIVVFWTFADSIICAGGANHPFTHPGFSWMVVSCRVVLRARNRPHRRSSSGRGVVAATNAVRFSLSAAPVIEASDIAAPLAGPGPACSSAAPPTGDTSSPSQANRLTAFVSAPIGDGSVALA